jgi:hypothetical protein
LHETEAPPARRSVKTPFWSKGNLLTSLGWNRTRFFVQSASALQPSDRQGGQSASRLCHSLRKADQPRLLERRVHPRDPSVSLVIVDRRKPSPPGTGAPKVYGRSTGFTASLRRSATLASFRPAFVVLSLPQMEDRDKLNASVLPGPPGRQSVARFVPAERKPNRRVCPHPFVTHARPPPF